MWTGIHSTWSWHNSVSIATDYGMDGWLGFDSRQGQESFLFSTVPRLALGPTQPHIQWVGGVVSLGVKRPAREADHSRPSSAKDKNGAAIPPLPHMS
jgi:hypothetical protein